jgi:hypothetical protein
MIADCRLKIEERQKTKEFKAQTELAGFGFCNPQSAILN